MEMTEINIEDALEIAEGSRSYNMMDARGAIRAFFDALGFKNKKIFLPKGETLQRWMDRLAQAYHEKTEGSGVVDLIVKEAKDLVDELNKSSAKS